MDEKVLQAAKSVCDLTSIAIRYYKDGETIAFFAPENYPSDADDPFEPFTDQLHLFNSPINCLTTPNQFYFGILYFDSSYLILGPVRDTPVSSETLRQVACRVDPSGKQTDKIIDALKGCIKLAVPSLISLLTSIYTMINFPKREGVNLFTDSMPYYKITYFENYSNESVLHLETLEDLFLSLIEKGDVPALREWYRTHGPANICADLTGDSLRNAKDSFVVISSLIAKAATQGGLERLLTMETQLNYIRAAEKMTSATEVFSLHRKIALQLAEQVNSLKNMPIKTKLVEDAIQYIQRNMTQPINTSDIAEALGVSRGYLSKSFHAETGMTISFFIQKIRIDEAKKLLKNTPMSLAAISDALGFSSQGYFTRVFKKSTGITPNKYRNHPVCMSEIDSF